MDGWTDGWVEGWWIEWMGGWRDEWVIQPLPFTCSDSVETLQLVRLTLSLSTSKLLDSDSAQPVTKSQLHFYMVL
jgi:hypothetical protein